MLLRTHNLPVRVDGGDTNVDLEPAWQKRILDLNDAYVVVLSAGDGHKLRTEHAFPTLSLSLARVEQIILLNRQAEKKLAVFA